MYILVAEQRAQEQEQSGVIKIEETDGPSLANDGLEFDETTEFVRAISYNPATIKAEPRPEPSLAAPQPSTSAVKKEEPSEDQPMTELEAGEVRIKEEEDDDDIDMAMLDDIEDALKAEDAATTNGDSSGGVGTSSEQTFSSGMASTLQILRNQGILAAPSADSTDREGVQLQRDLWLAQQRSRIAQRELQKLANRGTAKDQSTREYENRMREQQDARENLDAFKNYKPDVNIVYYDEFGRTLTPKEAWKALSHKFHGKGSGRMKTEKMLKKIAEERKMEAMQSGDTPLSMQKAFQMRQEKTGQAHFVLSVGNRGYVDSFLPSSSPRYRADCRFTVPFPRPPSFSSLSRYRKARRRRRTRRRAVLRAKHPLSKRSSKASSRSPHLVMFWAQTTAVEWVHQCPGPLRRNLGSLGLPLRLTPLPVARRRRFRMEVIGRRWRLGLGRLGVRGRPLRS